MSTEPFRVIRFGNLDPDVSDDEICRTVLKAMGNFKYMSAKVVEEPGKDRYVYAVFRSTEDAEAAYEKNKDIVLCERSADVFPVPLTDPVMDDLPQARQEAKDRAGRGRGRGRASYSFRARGRGRGGFSDKSRHNTSHFHPNPASKPKFRRPGRHLFVGGLAPCTSEKDLRRIFEPYGFVEEVDRKPNYAFVKFFTIDMALRARRAMTGQEIDGAVWRIGFGTTAPRPCLLVSRIGPWTNEKEIVDEFSLYGKVEKFFWPPNTNYAYVLYERMRYAQDAYEALHGHNFGRPGREILIDFAEIGQMESPLNFKECAHEESNDDIDWQKYDFDAEEEEADAEYSRNVSHDDYDYDQYTPEFDQRDDDYNHPESCERTRHDDRSDRYARDDDTHGRSYDRGNGNRRRSDWRGRGNNDRGFGMAARRGHWERSDRHRDYDRADRDFDRGDRGFDRGDRDFDRRDRDRDFDRVDRDRGFDRVDDRRDFTRRDARDFDRDDHRDHKRNGGRGYDRGARRGYERDDRRDYNREDQRSRDRFDRRSFGRDERRSYERDERRSYERDEPRSPRNMSVRNRSRRDRSLSSGRNSMRDNRSSERNGMRDNRSRSMSQDRGNRKKPRWSRSPVRDDKDSFASNFAAKRSQPLLPDPMASSSSQPYVPIYQPPASTIPIYPQNPVGVFPPSNILPVPGYPPPTLPETFPPAPMSFYPLVSQPLPDFSVPPPAIRSLPEPQAALNTMRGDFGGARKDIMSNFPVVWSGALVLKNSAFVTNMYLLSGSVPLVDALLRDKSADCPVLKITQRLRLDEPDKVKEVDRRVNMSGRNGCSVLLAVPASAEVGDVNNVIQQRPLSSLGSYLREKSVAAVILLPPGSGVGSHTGILHAFPPCEFAREFLKKEAPELAKDYPKDDHLLVIVMRESTDAHR